MTMKNVRRKTSETSSSIRCCKKNCQRILPSNHPSWYTNGLCEKHFYSMDFSTSDDENLSKRFESSTNTNIERGDIRQTREIFDGEKWRIVTQTIHRPSSMIDNDSSNFTLTKMNHEENFYQILRFLTNYQTIQDELKVNFDELIFAKKTSF